MKIADNLGAALDTVDRIEDFIMLALVYLNAPD